MPVEAAAFSRSILLNIMQYVSKTSSRCQTILIFLSIEGSEWYIFILDAKPRICGTAKYVLAKSKRWVYKFRISTVASRLPRLELGFVGRGGPCQAYINPLNPELNPICYLLALIGAHHFLHVSRIRVKVLTFRLLMSYIYIWSAHSWCF